MTPKEKAEELFNNMCNANYGFIYELDKEPYNTAKQCALIAVDEIIGNIVNTSIDYGASWTYWQQVKQELEAL